MRPQEGRRYPDEAFYFDRGELVVDREALPESFPSVRCLTGKSTVGTYINPNGEIRTRKHSDTYWSSSFTPGSRLLKVQSGDGELVRTPSDDGPYYHMECEGAITGEYEIGDNDTIIAWRQTEDSAELVMLPASEPLPSIEYYRTSYEILGVVTTAGELISWGSEGKVARNRVDLALASNLVNNRLGNYILDREVDSFSLLGLVDNELVRAYLELFNQRFSVDFMPTQEPDNRMKEFPEPLTREQLGRYKNI